MVASGKTVDISIQVPVTQLGYYDVATKRWKVEPGKYKILVGSSSKEIRQTAVITVS